MKMKIRTEINQKKNVRVHILSGEFNVDSLFNTLTDIYSSLPLSAEMNVLWDLRGAEGISSLASNQLNEVVGLVGNKWGANRKNKAALVVSKEVDFGQANVYEMQLKNQSLSKFRVFKDIKKAIQWIDQETH